MQDKAIIKIWANLLTIKEDIEKTVWMFTILFTYWFKLLLIAIKN